MKETFGMKDVKLSILDEEFNSQMRELLRNRPELVKIELSEISLFMRKPKEILLETEEFLPETSVIDFMTNVFSKFTELEDFRKIWGKDDLKQVVVKDFLEYVGLPLPKVKFPFKKYPVPGFMEPILEDIQGQDEIPFPLRHYVDVDKEMLENFMYIFEMSFDSDHCAPNGVAVTKMIIDLGDKGTGDHEHELLAFPDMIEEIYQKKKLVEFASKRISGLKTLIIQWDHLFEVEELLESLGVFLLAQKETLTTIVLDLEHHSVPAVVGGYPMSFLADPEDEEDPQRILYRLITNNCSMLKKLIVIERSGDEGNSFDKLFPFEWNCEIEKKNLQNM